MDKVYVFLLLTFTTLSVYPQSKTASSITELSDLWLNSYQHYQTNHNLGSKANALKVFKNFSADTLSYNNQKSEIQELIAQEIESDFGLNFRADYMYNPSGGEQDFDNIIYNSRLSSSVRWDILKNGFLANKSKAKIARNKAKIAEIEQYELLKNAQYSRVWNAVIYQFNLHKIKILDQRKELAEKRVDIIKDLYLSQKVNQEEFLKHLESLAEVRSLLETYQSFNSKLDDTHHFKNIRLTELPIIDLDYEVLRSKIQGVENDSIAFYKKENIDLQNKLIDDISLQTYVRYSYYDLVKTNPGHRDFMSVGLSLGVPLKFGHQAKRKRMALEKESLTYLPPEDRINLEKEVLTNYYEFRYKLKQISNQQFKKLGYIELLRQENARKEIDTLSFNPVSSLRLLDDLMKVDLELIDLKQQSYLKLLQINASLPYTNLEELFTVKQLNEDAFKIKTNYKSVYIWSNIFKDYDLNFIINYIRKKSFKEIILAIGQNDPYLSQKKELKNSKLKSTKLMKKILL